MLFKDFVVNLKKNVEKFEQEFEQTYPDMLGKDIWEGDWEEQFHFWYEQHAEFTGEDEL